VSENKVLGGMFWSKGQERLRKLYNKNHNLHFLPTTDRLKKARWEGCMMAYKI
jgi:hypothetical protein